jgi:hypothetical protein
MMASVLVGASLDDEHDKVAIGDEDKEGYVGDDRALEVESGFLYK